VVVLSRGILHFAGLAWRTFRAREF
jgi:hypothetical protein